MKFTSGVERMTNHSWLDYGGDPDRGADPGII